MNTSTQVPPTSVLLVEDSAGDARLIVEMLRDAGAGAFQLEHVDRLASALERLNRSAVDVVLLDLGLPDNQGLRTFELTRQAVPDQPIVVISGLDDEAVALQAVRLGAQDYLVKGRIEGHVLARVIRYALERKRAERELAKTQSRFRALVENSWDAISVLAIDGTILYASPATQRVLGYSPDEVVGHNSLEYVRLDSREFAAQQFAESVRRPREPVPAHGYFAHKDGSWRLLEGTFTNLVDEPSVGGIVNNYRDVTEQHRSEERIRWLTFAVDQGPASVIMTDASGNIEYVNQKFTENTGYATAEALGKRPSILKSGTTSHDEYARLWDTIKAGKPYRGEIQNRRKNGDLWWDDVQISPVRDETGAITHFLGVQTDITEQKKIGLALSETNDRFRELADNISEIFFVFDAQFRETLYINDAYERISGRSARSLYDEPKSFIDLIAPEDQPRLLADIGRIQRGEHPPNAEFRLVRPDGTTRWVLVHAVPVRDERGKVYRISGVVLDVTDQRAMQLALEESVGRYRKLTEASFDAIAVSQDGVYREVNRGFLDTFGFEHEDEVIGRRVIDFNAPESAEEVRMHVSENIEGTYEFVGKRKDGKKIALEVTARAHAFNGKPGRIAAMRDVTEKRSLEEQFRQAQKMEAVGRLAGGVAHDFNNLLTVITGNTELLLMEMMAGDPRADDLEQIRKASHAAGGLTRQLLAFSRQQVIEPRTVALGEVVERATKLLSSLIGEDIEVAMSLSDEPCLVHIDPGQLEQVIMNLALNARDAMPMGGKLTIETAVVNLDDGGAIAHWPVSPGRFALLAVSDTGVGMDAATREHIFEPFFTTKEQGKGTGLGLSTVYGIVKQNGGSIGVYSETGMGTTFKVYLPLVVDASAPEIHASDAPSAPQGSETVMLVEDAADVRDVARRALKRHGYVVIECSSAIEALSLAMQAGRRIDLLVTDVVMPQMSGRVLAERFAELYPSAKVLFMSGYTDDAIVRHGVLSASMPYLQKPFTPHGLAAKVREVLDA